MIPNSLSDLPRRIQNRTVRLCVVGLGYVGLPLAVAFANAGCRTVGVDTDRSRIEAAAQGRPYVRDRTVEIALPRLIKNGSLVATLELESGIEQSDFIILCLPTLL